MYPTQVEVRNIGGIFFMQKLKIRELILAGLFVALITAGTFISGRRRLHIAVFIYAVGGVSFGRKTRHFCGRRVCFDGLDWNPGFCVGRRAGIFISTDFRLFARIYFAGVVLRKIFKKYFGNKFQKFVADKFRRNVDSLFNRHGLVLRRVKFRYRCACCVLDNDFLQFCFASRAGRNTLRGGGDFGGALS